jgi:hypothetical protein
MVARIFADCHIFIAKYRDASLTMCFLPESFTESACPTHSECHLNVIAVLHPSRVPYIGKLSLFVSHPELADIQSLTEGR